MKHKFVRLILTIGAIVGLGLGIASPAQSSPSAGERMSVLNEQVNSAHQKLEEYEQKTAEGQRKLDDVKARLKKQQLVVARNSIVFYIHASVNALPVSGFDVGTDLAKGPYSDAAGARDVKLVHALTNTKHELDKTQAELNRDQKFVKLVSKSLDDKLLLMQRLNSRVQGSMFSNTYAWPDVPAPNAQAAAAVAYARAQLGKPYIYGGVGPVGYDCSGLTMMAYAQVGISMPHGSIAQGNIFPRVPNDQMAPGDLLIYYPDHGHVAIYIGNGLQIAAPHTGTDIQIQPIYSAFQYAVRPTGLP